MADEAFLARSYDAFASVEEAFNEVLDESPRGPEMLFDYALIWCRDALVHVDDLAAAFAEFRRVLAPGGRALVYQMFCTDRLEPREAAWLLPTMGCVEANMRPDHAEAAMRKAGLLIEERVVLGTEWGEYGEERSGKGSRNLLHAARLLSEPDRYIERFGQDNYDIALGDCLWHVYRLIGKLSDRVYLLSR